MKSNKEMIEAVFSRIKEEKTKERKKWPNRVYAVSMLGIVLTILIGLGVWIGGEIRNGEIGPLQSGETQYHGTEDAIGKVTESEEVAIDYELLARIEQAVWAEEKLYDGEIIEDAIEPRRQYGNGFDCEGALYDYLINDPEKIYAIVVVPRGEDNTKERTRLIKEQMDTQGIINFVYMNRASGQINCYILVTAEEFAQISLENAQDYWFNHALKPTKIEEILFPEIHGK